LVWYSKGVEQRTGLRERKKNATWELLRKTALDLFEERGFENVSVAEIAAAAEVSKATVFNYFPSKEDLVIGGMKHHTGDAARIVRERRRGETPLSALREHYLRMLERRAPQTGLSDDPMFLRVQALLVATPSLRISAMDYRRQSAVQLAAALIEEGQAKLTARLVASQLLHTQHILVEANVHLILEGKPLDEVQTMATSAAEHAFGLLEHGVGRGGLGLAAHEVADAAFTPDGCRIGFEPGEPEAREAAQRILDEHGGELLQALSEQRRP
jgi:AcrR family transcriptional regulator